jgi:O-acetylhomoserine (thiol)-lyase
MSVAFLADSKHETPAQRPSLESFACGRDTHPKRSLKMPSSSSHPQTIALHAGYRKDASTNAVAVPIYQSTAFQFDDTAHAADLFALKQFGNIYSRIANPTCDVLEQRMAALDGGAAALAVSSGQAATAIAIQNIAQAGDNIVSSTDIYGGTWNLFANTLRTCGIEVRFADPSNPDNFRRLADERTRAFFAETLPNPKLEVFPIGEVAAIGEDLGIPLVVDNTAAPLICRPLDYGAHIVVYSTTKYIGGHGTSIGGMIIDGGRFDWERHAARFPMLNMPDPSYHGAVWTEAARPLGPVAYLIKARVTLQRDYGASMSPFNAFQFIQGLETLTLRMREHCSNAARVAQHLLQHPAVARVVYPGLREGIAAERARTYMKGGYGGLVGFELKGGRVAGQQFIDALQLFYHVANIGDARSLAIHPASTTHSQLKPAEQIASGVTPGFVRLSVGIEHIEDILHDLDQALAATTTAAWAA